MKDQSTYDEALALKLEVKPAKHAWTIPLLRHTAMG